jgi:hypothetical protein
MTLIEIGEIGLGSSRAPRKKAEDPEDPEKAPTSKQADAAE